MKIAYEQVGNVKPVQNKKMKNQHIRLANQRARKFISCIDTNYYIVDTDHMTSHDLYLKISCQGSVQTTQD